MNDRHHPHACIPSAPAEVALRGAMRVPRSPSVASPFERVNAFDTGAPGWYATRSRRGAARGSPATPSR